MRRKALVFPGESRYITEAQASENNARYWEREAEKETNPKMHEICLKMAYVCRDMAKWYKDQGL